MKLRLIKIPFAIAILSLASLFSQFTLADDASATKTIVSILVNLKHFPSDADKTALMAIGADKSTSPSIKAIANAVHNIKHTASASDKAILSAIDAGDSAKALSDIVLGIRHIPSDDAKAKLQAMM